MSVFKGIFKKLGLASGKKAKPESADESPPENSIVGSGGGGQVRDLNDANEEVLSDAGGGAVNMRSIMQGDDAVPQQSGEFVHISE